MSMPTGTKRVAVLGVQVPFVRGGAEYLNEELVRQINLWGQSKNIKAELIQLPYKWYPETQILSDMLAWRMLDISESNGVKVDLAIATKFPSYASSHPNLGLWLVHQHRVLYDLQGTVYDAAHLTHEQHEVRDSLRSIDKRMLEGIGARFTISSTVTDRLQNFCGLASSVLYPPSRLATAIYPGDYGDYILYVGRLETIKRPNLLIEALAHCKSGRAVIAGAGAQFDELRRLAEKLGLTDRVELKGFVDDDELLELIAGCRAIFYAPVDEDFGFATIEAFHAFKPVITSDDSGEVERIVSQTQSGWVSASSPFALAESLRECFAESSDRLKSMASAGYELARGITWDNVIQNLVEPRL
jgi:glycosyltransferase involved in cell wall biosynthesis